MKQRDIAKRWLRGHTGRVYAWVNFNPDSGEYVQIVKKDAIAILTQRYEPETEIDIRQEYGALYIG